MVDGRHKRDWSGDNAIISYCHIASPINGRVGLRLVDPGNLVTANSTTTLVVVTQIQPITVIFPLNEDDLPQVLEHRKGGKQLKVDVFDRNQQKLLSSGKLATIDNQIDTTTGTVKLRAAFDNKDGILSRNRHSKRSRTAFSCRNIRRDVSPGIQSR